MATLSLNEIRDVVWRWDPIGVGAAQPDAADEYDEISMKICSAIARGGGVGAVKRIAEDFVSDLGIRAPGLDEFMVEVGELLATQ